jgi:hypothetical protein
MNIDVEPNYIIEEEDREPWVLPENALTIVMYSDGAFKLYDSRYTTTETKNCWDYSFTCMLLLRALNGDTQSRDILMLQMNRFNII